MATLNGTAGNDQITGTDDRDEINGLAGDDTLFGLGGNDTILAGGGKDQIDGGSGDDDLQGGDGDDKIVGGAGDDILSGGAGKNLLEGGSGLDTAVFSGEFASYQTKIDQANLKGEITLNGVGTKFAGVERLQFADRTIYLLPDDGPVNTITGTDGPDNLVGTAGRDAISALGGDDTLSGLGGADALDGGGDYDTVSYANSPSAVTINFETGVASGGDAAGDTYVSIEQVVGSNHNDVMTGDGFVWIDGLSSRVLIGGPGADTLLGGPAVDGFVVNTGDVVPGDIIDGRGGFENLPIYDGGVIEARSSTDVSAASISNIGQIQFNAPGPISMTFSGDQVNGEDWAVFTAGASRFISGNDVIVNAGNGETVDISGFYVTGNQTDFFLNGASGSETLIGSDHAGDIINGKAGSDNVSGMAGQDLFLLHKGETNGDVITDFNSAEGDRLQFEGYAGDATLTNDNDQWTVADSSGSETFTLSGVTSLSASDYAFA